jgi:N12 class adenine-specific DNA methylase
MDKDNAEINKRSIDNLENDGIMTSESSEGDDNGNSQRNSKSADRESSGVSAERRDLERENPQLPQREQTPISQADEKRQQPGELHQHGNPVVPANSRKPDRAREHGGRGVEQGDQTRDSGERDGLGSVTPGAVETSQPHDIILRNKEDIGANMGAAARFDANLSAIKTIKKIKTDGRHATPDEQAVLAKYSGFGDSQFNPAFEHYYGRENEAWKRRGEELKTITTEEEYKAIEGSRLNAFYTEPEIVKAMWSGLERLGVGKLKSPHVLEPSAGSGRFLGYQPTELAARSQRTAVELDKLTGSILKEAYPQSEVYITGFENAPLPKDSFDIALSNVPFGNYPVFDPSFKKQRSVLKNQIHNYFFAKTLEKLRPGGVLAFITSHGTLDAPSSQPQREIMAGEADFIGAIRLPTKAFSDTDVCTDIIYMRKRNPGEPPGDKTWTETAEIELDGENNKVKKNINKYYLLHPEMVLGDHSAKGRMRHYDEYTVEAKPGVNLIDSLNQATSRLPQGVLNELPPLPPRSISADSAVNVKENSRVIDKDGTVRIKRNGMLEKADYNANEAERVTQILKVRDAARKTLEVQLREGTDSEIAEAQKELNREYQEFTGKYGALRNKANADLMKGDPDGPFIMALEKGLPAKKEDKASWQALIKAKSLNLEQQAKLKMGIFSGRTVKGLGFQIIKDVSDAMAVAYNETGRLDFDRMGQLLGKSPDAVIRELADKGEIYKNPTGDWEPASQYLSGEVREKLRAAELAADANPRFKKNVEALKKAQPADLKPSEINISLGAPWIPASDVNDFVREITGASTWRDRNKYFAYVSQTGQWITADKVDGNENKMSSEWGTARMPANKLVELILNGKLIEVKDKVTEDGKEVSVRNGPETIAAQEKAEAIERRFREWVWEDGERAARLLKDYNETYNCRRSRQYDGKHLVFPGMAEKWTKQIHPHQKDAVWRVVQDGTALLAHEVGFGKTAVMVAAGMEKRRLGLSRKNVYVVPKPTHSQFLEQFADIYPYANVLAPVDDDFSTAKRAEFISRVATNDWDAVILTYDQFRRIPLKPETEARFLEGEIASYEAALNAMDVYEDEDDSGYRWSRRRKDAAKEKTQKQIQQAIKTMRVRLAELQEKSHAIGDKTIYFEDLGVDQVFVDEADNFKNLQFATNMGRLKGLPNTHSDRAWDMYSKTRYLQEQGKGHGVVFATGTPVANTIAEMYTMMRYLQEPMLEAKKIQHFDAWAKTFGETTESLEQTPTGQYKMTQRFARFQNAPELSQLWQDVADIRVADEVPGIAKLRPRIVDDKGKPRRTIIAIPQDNALKEYMKVLVKRADNLKHVDPRDDNMLKLCNDANKAALDMRMINPNAPGNPNGKIATLAREISKRYEKTMPDKGTQLVFLDLGTPKAKEPIDDNKEVVSIDGQIDEEEETAEEKKLLENVYATIKDSLISSGIPKGEIAFIHDAKTDEQKKVLQSKVRSGDIRVVIGSTSKLGTGVNVQDRVAALHHVDAPWRPRDIEQREGRGIRQGNKVYGPKLDDKGNVLDPGKGVEILTYVTEGSFDGYRWQAVESKSKAIKSIMRRENPPRAIEDCDSFTMSASEAKAVASGNPDVMKQVTLKNSVTRLQMLRSSHLDSQIRAKEQLQKLPASIKQLEEQITKMEKDAGKAKAETAFALTVNGQTINERPDASEALKAAVQSTPVDTSKATTIAKYKGYEISVTNLGAAAGYSIRLKNPDTGMEYAVAGSIPYNELTTGILTRVENTIKKIVTELEANKREVEQQRLSLKGYEKQANQTFEYEGRLKGMENELDRLSRKLQGQQVSDTPSDNYISDDDIPEPADEYRFTPKEPELEQKINPKAEIEAVKAEVAPVEKSLEVKEPTTTELNLVEKAIDTMSNTVTKEDVSDPIISEPTDNLTILEKAKIIEDAFKKEKTEHPEKRESLHPINKETFQMTISEFNKEYPTPNDLPLDKQLDLYNWIQKANLEEMGEESTMKFDEFMKEFGNSHFNLETLNMFFDTHKEMVLKAIKNNLSVPDNVRAEYKEDIAQLEAKNNKSKAVRLKKQAAKEAAIAKPEMVQEQTQNEEPIKEMDVRADEALTPQKGSAEADKKKTEIDSSKLSIEVGDKKYQVDSLADASSKYRDTLKNFLETTGRSTDEIPHEYRNPLLKDAAGNVIGYIAHNGRIFPGKEYDESIDAIYNPPGWKPVSLETKSYDGRVAKAQLEKLRNKHPELEFRFEETGPATDKKYKIIGEALKPQNEPEPKKIEPLEKHVTKETSLPEPDGRNGQYSMKQIRQLHAARSERSQAIDESKANAKTLQPGDKKISRWIKDPGAADISGVDTKNKERVKPYLQTAIKKNNAKTKTKTIKLLQSRIPIKGAKMNAGKNKGGVVNKGPSYKSKPLGQMYITKMGNKSKVISRAPIGRRRRRG